MIPDQPLLSICIPTYNRSAHLDRQLLKITTMIQNHWDKCELIVSDNASTDDSPNVCSNWAQRLQGRRFVTKRQQRNLGLVGNCKACIHIAKGKYVWLVGDDDPIYNDPIGFVINALETYPDLTFLHLNHRCVDADETTVFNQRYYPWEDDQIDVNGRVLFEKTISYGVGAQYFITACIVQRSLALKAEEQWPTGIRNLAWPMYIFAFAASRGRMMVSKNIYIDCVYNRSSWTKSLTRLFFHDEPEIYLRMLQLGFSRSVLKQATKKRLAVWRLRRSFALIKTMIIPHPLDTLRAIGYQIRLLR